MTNTDNAAAVIDTAGLSFLCRWGHTPLDDAKIFGHKEIAKFIEDFMRKEGISMTSTASGEPAN